LAPLALLLGLVLDASLDVPYLDDFDAFLAFLNRVRDETGARVRLALLFAPHNEHLIALPRALGLFSLALLGRLDFALLNAVACAELALLCVGLLLAFRRDAPLAQRLLPFAPAALLTLHPQYWTALLWPTTSLSNFGVMAFAALAFALLTRPGRAAGAGAALAAFAALFSQGNGVLALPLAPAVPWLCGARRRAAAAAAVAGLLLVLYVALQERAAAAADLGVNLRHPGRALAYALNLAGCAPGFSQPWLSPLLGAALAAASAVLLWRGLARRSPALFALLLFLWASLAANALVRAHQGAATPLLQPRYRFYSALLLALTHLSWLELARGARRERAGLRAALAVSLLFCAASFAAYAGEVRALSGRLEAGLERWWSSGEGGLFHPDLRKADFYLLRSYGRGLLRPTPQLVARERVGPTRLPPAEADGGVKLRLDALHHAEGVLLAAGVAWAGASAREQQVELVLGSDRALYAFPAHPVARSDLPGDDPKSAWRLGRSGFRALAATDDLPPGRYRVGVRVRRGDSVHLSFSRRTLVLR
jgi:hypothetical protein